MAVDVDRSEKINIGLTVRSEVEAQKVIGYSRKAGGYWEFSWTTMTLIREYKVTGANILCLGILIPGLRRKCSLRSWDILRGTEMVNYRCLDVFGGYFNLVCCRSPQII